jgi:hypothetical protein
MSCVGVEYGNLRELCLARMADLGLKCRDVRTREVGIQDIHFKIKPDQVELVRRDYVGMCGLLPLCVSHVWSVYGLLDAQALTHSCTVVIVYSEWWLGDFSFLRRSSTGYFDWFVAIAQVQSTILPT